MIRCVDHVPIGAQNFEALKFSENHVFIIDEQDWRKNIF